ncbi:MAG: ABC transporter permease [Anaerolineae bacterium]
MAESTGVQRLDAAVRTATQRFWPTRRLTERLSTPAALLVLLIGWEVVGRVSNAVFFPPFSGVARAWWTLALSGDLGRAMTTSLQALAVGFGLAVVLGIAIGTAMGLSRTISYLLDIYVNTLMAAPLIALIPIIAIFLGLDVWARAAVVFLFSFFVITVNAEAGMKAVDSELVEMARSFGLGRWQVFVMVILPAALPAILAGLRLGIIRAVKGMVTAEMFMAITGLGALLDYYGSAFKGAELFAVLLTVIAVSVMAGAVMHQLDRRLSRWQRGIARE